MIGSTGPLATCHQSLISSSLFRFGRTAFQNPSSRSSRPILARRTFTSSNGVSWMIFWFRRSSSSISNLGAPFENLVRSNSLTNGSRLENGTIGSALPRRASKLTIAIGSSFSLSRKSRALIDPKRLDSLPPSLSEIIGRCANTGGL